MTQVAYEFIGVAGVGTLLCGLIAIIWRLLGDHSDEDDWDL